MAYKTDRYVFCGINIVIPVILGAVLYIILSPDVWFIRWINRLTGINLESLCIWNTELAALIDTNDKYMEFIKIIRNYVPDILWAYSLVFTVFAISDNNSAHIYRQFALSFLYCVIIEMLQIIPWIRGTFDIWDIIMECIAQILAVFIINIHCAHVKEHEEDG